MEITRRSASSSPPRLVSIHYVTAHHLIRSFGGKRQKRRRGPAPSSVWSIVEFFGIIVGTVLPRSLREVGDGRMEKIQ